MVTTVTLGCGAQSEDRHTTQADAENEMRCLTAGRTHALSSAAFYSTCHNAYVARERDTDPHSKDDSAVIAAMEKIYAASALIELHRTQEARDLVRQAKITFTIVAATTDDPTARSRAKTMRSCLIDQDPKCLAAWAKNAETSNNH